MTVNPDDYRMPILEHLRELRSRIIVCLWALIGSFFLAFFFANEIFGFLAEPMNEALKATDGGTLAVTEAMEGFMVQMKVAAMTAIFISLPVLSYQSWRFIAPALYDQEKRWAVPLMVASTSLFLAGAGFAYFVVFRFGFPVFLEMNGEDVKAVLSIQSYLSFATTLLVAFGSAFQLPVVIYFLARIGVIDHIDLVRGFRYSVVIIFVVAAILTPPDVLSQLLMAGPLLVLYGVGIGVARIATTKRRD